MFLAVGLGLGTAIPSKVLAVPYSAEVVGTKVNVAGQCTWTYKVSNTSTSSDYSLWLFAVQVDEGADVISATCPSGWIADTDSMPHFITWEYFASEMPAGTFKTGFDVEFNRDPVSQVYTAMFDNTATGESPSVDGVVLTPEPAGIAALLTGLAPLAGLIARRRNRVKLS